MTRDTRELAAMMTTLGKLTNLGLFAALLGGAFLAAHGNGLGAYVIVAIAAAANFVTRGAANFLKMLSKREVST